MFTIFITFLLCSEHREGKEESQCLKGGREDRERAERAGVGGKPVKVCSSTEENIFSRTDCMVCSVVGVG